MSITNVYPRDRASLPLAPPYPLLAAEVQAEDQSVSAGGARTIDIGGLTVSDVGYQNSSAHSFSIKEDN